MDDRVAAWCFLCDVPVDGARCPTCGREPTTVEESADEGAAVPPRWRRIPRGVWLTMVVFVVIVLFALQQSGFRLGPG